MTPAERVALREARAKIDQALGEPSVNDPELVALLNQLARTPTSHTVEVSRLAYEIAAQWVYVRG